MRTKTNLAALAALLLGIAASGCDATPIGGPRPTDAGVRVDAVFEPGTDANLPEPPPPDAAFLPGEDAPMLASDAPSLPLDCTVFASAADVQLCDASPTQCTLVYAASLGCDAACALGGLRCAEGYEDVTGMCAADETRPALGCASGHVSDFCVCVSDSCTPSCAGRLCGDDGCGGSCGTCPGTGAECVAGACMCEPATCAELPRACGVVDDGCGGTIDCTRACSGGAACVAGTCETEVLCSPSSCVAFPGAEGEGRFATGGRGGDVYHVTTLSNSGSGSLREGLTSARRARTIVFDVAGRIDLTSMLSASVSRVTIAGQTAPGDGITVSGYGLVLRGNDNIVQHIRFRAGDEHKATASRSGFTDDSIQLSGTRIMVDHVSASWGIDECLSAGSEWDDMTIQHSIISEGLMRTRLFHGEYVADHPGHSMGGLYKAMSGDTHITIHHTLFAHNNNRNPALGAYEASQRQWADLRNNVIYDAPTMGYASGLQEVLYLNYVGNYAVFGPDSSTRDLFDLDPEDHGRVYASGNFLDTDRDGRCDGTDVGWAAIGGSYSRTSEVAMEPVVTESAPAALERVLAQSGARPWSRDDVDDRVIESVRRQTGGIIDSQDDVGGWGTLAGGTRVVDGDGDGMPDDYERTAGTNPSSPDNNGDVDGDGYTNLENFLHHAARLTR